MPRHLDDKSVGENDRHRRLIRVTSGFLGRPCKRVSQNRVWIHRPACPIESTLAPLNRVPGYLSTVAVAICTLALVKN